MNGTNNPKILIIRLSSLGDIILTAPVIRNLKKHWANAQIDYLVKPRFAEALTGNNLINKVIRFNDLISVVNAVNANEYDLIIDLHANLRSMLICFFSNAKKIIRYKKASLARRFFVKMRIPSPSLEKHTLERYLDVLKSIGVPCFFTGPQLADSENAYSFNIQKPAKICILQTAFLGDCVLTLPLLKKLRDTLPQSEIAVVTRPETAQIFTSPEFKNVEVITDNKKHAKSKLAEFNRLVKILSSHNFDAAVIPHRSIRSALLAWKAGIPIRIGFTSGAGSFLMTHKIHFSWLMHDIERNLSLLSPFTKDLTTALSGIMQTPKGIDLEISKDIIIGINAGSAWPTKRWPAENWASLIQKLSKHFNSKILLLGGKSEIEWNNSIVKMAGEQYCFDLTGKTTMTQLIKAIRGLKIFISNDSGPMHIACALGVPTIGIFGPTTKELGFFPYGSNNSVIQSDLKCRPCALHGSKTCPHKHFLCMKLITVNDVYDEILKSLIS